MNTILITGGNRGIGFSLVKLYLEQGWSVHTTYRSADS
ncbi:short-chain dehydrogenase, partial [Vibrio sinaloensis]